MQRWFWRPCVPQVVFIGRQWPCRCPNIIIAIVVCRAEQTLKPLCAPPPPAAATDSTLHENMQISIKTENISIKLHIPGWCFQGDSYLKKKTASLSFMCRQAAWSLPCQALVSIIYVKLCSPDLLGSVQSGKKGGEKSGFISTFTAKLFCWELCISLIIVLSVKWMRRNSWHNIMLKIQFHIDWQCEIHQAHVMAFCTIRAYCGVICIGKRGHLLGVIS